MIKRYFYLLLAISLAMPLVSGCSSDDSSETPQHPSLNDIKQTENDSKSNVLFAIDNSNGIKLDESVNSEINISSNKVISGDGFSFSEGFDCNNLSTLPDYSTVKQWTSSAVAKAGTSYWLSYQLPSHIVMFKLRVAYIDGVNVGVEYKVSQIIPTDNANANDPAQGQAYVTEYEMPHLLSSNTYVEHDVTNNGKKILNYALEWNSTMNHSRWVAYSFDAVTAAKNTSRTDAWAVDPLLPKSMQVDDTWHTNDGFDRGHLCSSDDRSFSTDANKQTFFFSNMSPMLNSFNSGYWGTFEQLVLSWIRNGKVLGDKYDKVYVAKGGTLDKLLINFTGTKAGGDNKIPTTNEKGLTVKGLPVPKYYFMAILAHRANQPADDASAYQAIGFWVEHRDDYGYTFNKPLAKKDTKKSAVSIDELESKTGIDFFCNLPDKIENAVESSYKETDWTWEY